MHNKQTLRQKLKKYLYNHFQKLKYIRKFRQKISIVLYQKFFELEILLIKSEPYIHDTINQRNYKHISYQRTIYIIKFSSTTIFQYS